MGAPMMNLSGSGPSSTSSSFAFFRPAEQGLTVGILDVQPAIGGGGRSSSWGALAGSVVVLSAVETAPGTFRRDGCAGIRSDHRQGRGGTAHHNLGGHGIGRCGQHGLGDLHGGGNIRFRRIDGRAHLGRRQGVVTGGAARRALPPPGDGEPDQHQDHQPGHHLEPAVIGLLAGATGEALHVDVVGGVSPSFS